MNVIEALFITLGLDTSEFDKKRKGVDASLTKLGETSDKQTKVIAESGKKAAHAFSLLKVEVLGALAAFGFGDGLKSFVESSMNGQAAAGRMSSALGISVQSLQSYKLMAEEMGESGESAVATLNKVASGLAAARRGDSSFLNSANPYGAKLNLDDDVESAMSKINKMAYDIREKYGKQQAMGILSGMGITDFNQQQLLMESPAKYAASYAEAMRHSSGMTKESIQGAKDLQKQWAFFMRDMEKAKNSIFAKMEPVLIKLGHQLVKWLDGVDWNKVGDQAGRFAEKAEKLGEWLINLDWGKVRKRIDDFVDTVRHVVKEMGGWKTVAEILGGILALKILSPLLSLVITLGRLLPMFVGATTGVTGLAAAFGSLGFAIAGATGALAGYELWKHVLAGTKAGDAVGSIAAKVMAALGDKTAQDAVNRMEGRGPKAPSYFHPERTDWYKEKSKQAVGYFESQGFSRNASIGMAANIARESTFDPHAVGDHGKAYGLGQWHADRQADFAKVMGLPIQASSYQQQLAFYAHEVKHNKRLMDFLAQKPTAEASAMEISLLDERPANQQAEMIARAKIAEKMAEHFGALRSMIAAHKGGDAKAVKKATLSQSATRPVDAAGATPAHYGMTAAQTAYARTLVQPTPGARSAQPSPQVKGGASNSVSIGTLNVNAPKATDAKGVARGMQAAITSHPLIAGSVTGLA